MVPATGQFGNAGRNTMRGPGQNNFDFSLFKSFAFREIPDFLQFRAEFSTPSTIPSSFYPTASWTMPPSARFPAHAMVEIFNSHCGFTSNKVAKTCTAAPGRKSPGL
jgi:hypothetical protein